MGPPRPGWLTPWTASHVFYDLPVIYSVVLMWTFYTGMYNILQRTKLSDK